MAAIVAVEVVISLTPVAAPGGVIARRVILWAALAAAGRLSLPAAAYCPPAPLRRALRAA